MSTDRRAAILQAARTVLAERGPDAVSVRNIAAAAGIGASTLRYYFPAQIDLQLALATDTFHREIRDLRIEDTSVPATDRLCECLEQFLPSEDSEVTHLSSWISGYAAAVGRKAEEPQRKLLSVLETEANTRINAWLAVLDHEGVLRVDVDQARTLAQAMLDGLALSLLVKERGVTVDGARDLLRTTISRLIIATPAG